MDRIRLLQTDAALRFHGASPVAVHALTIYAPSVLGIRPKVGAFAFGLTHVLEAVAPLRRLHGTEVDPVLEEPWAALPREVGRIALRGIDCVPAGLGRTDPEALASAEPRREHNPPQHGPVRRPHAVTTGARGLALRG